MGAMSRRKGVRGELEAVTLLRPIFPAARRRCSGEESQDEYRGRDLDGTPGWCVQVGLGGNAIPARKLAEASTAASPGERPLALTRRDREPWLATVRVEDLIEIIERRFAINLAQATLLSVAEAIDDGDYVRAKDLALNGIAAFDPEPKNGG